MFGYPVKYAAGGDERFYREYSLSDEAMREAAYLLHNGDILLIRATLPHEMLDRNQQVEDILFAQEFSRWPDALLYDFTDPDAVQRVEEAVTGFLTAHSVPV